VNGSVADVRLTVRLVSDISTVPFLKYKYFGGKL